MKKFAIVFVLSIFISGCATSRSEITLDRKYSSHLNPSEAVGDIYIRHVSDRRQFEESPATPSIPSLGFGGAKAAPVSLTQRAVGRKRNAYGKALGDVLLKDTDVIELITKEFAEGLADYGYNVRRSPPNVIGANDLVVDIEITKFWSWFSPGFWAISLKSDIETNVTVVGNASLTRVSATAEERIQMATDGAWENVVNAALDRFRGRVNSAVPQLLANADAPEAENAKHSECVASAILVDSPSLRVKAIAACAEAN